MGLVKSSPLKSTLPSVTGISPARDGAFAAAAFADDAERVLRLHVEADAIDRSYIAPAPKQARRLPEVDFQPRDGEQVGFGVRGAGRRRLSLRGKRRLLAHGLPADAAYLMIRRDRFERRIGGGAGGDCQRTARGEDASLWQRRERRHATGDSVERRIAVARPFLRQAAQ
jgi:hypothetical protein